MNIGLSYTIGTIFSTQLAALFYSTLSNGRSLLWTNWSSDLNIGTFGNTCFIIMWQPEEVIIEIQLNLRTYRLPFIYGLHQSSIFCLANSRLQRCTGKQQSCLIVFIRLVIIKSTKFVGPL
ncbi:hypothetical protein BLOT_009064, partial [Blomia tropicalis]